MSIRCQLLVVSLLVGLGVGHCADSGWLNVQDLGASGSEFQTKASVTAGSRDVTVDDVGDFRVGQGVAIAGANPHFERPSLWGPGTQYIAKSGLPTKYIELRGWDNNGKSSTVYIIDFDRKTPTSFRWSDDIGRTWQPAQQVTGDWQTLRGTLQVKVLPYEWEKGWTFTFSAKDYLITTIEKIEGKTLTVRDPATATTATALVKHTDTQALQAAIDRALKEKRNLFLPAGRYRLTSGLRVENPTGITIEGANAGTTMLDISEGTGCCVQFRGGTEGTVRNLSMVGSAGFAERDQCGTIRMQGIGYIWGQDLHTTFATGVVGTERVLVENVHATRMSLEAFWSGGPGRVGTKEPPPQYTRALNYIRCSAIDCGRNGFNNNDYAENTSIQYCRIVDVGGCAWEGASRFVKIVGNYVRNAGTVAVGNMSNRSPEVEQLGSAQHIIEDNVFESNVPYGGCAIRAAHGATQVIIRNNLFINFNSSAIEVWGQGDERHLGSGMVTVAGNIMDMTCLDPTPKQRWAIYASTPETVIADNQIYVRGAVDPLVTGIKLIEGPSDLTVHDNLLRNLGQGLTVERATARVGEVVDDRSFIQSSGTVSQERRQSHRFQGWKIVWTAGGKPLGVSTIAEFDPEKRVFRLTEPKAMKPGDTFEIQPPYGTNWNLHHNTFAGCQIPVVLDGYGSATCAFDDNILSREAATGVKSAVEVKGLFGLNGNVFSGFDEPETVAVMLHPDRFGQPLPLLMRGNTYEACTAAVGEATPGLAKAVRQQ
ncbi:MAG: right-handed parallel beta-helix repeat-containing protein [Armatimonadia bacterium]